MNELSVPALQHASQSTPTSGMTTPTTPRPLDFNPLVTVVGFHHARGPEIETWFGAQEGEDPAVQNDWALLPFMALSDGAHAATEDFSYFTLLRPATATSPASSLFGVSCTRQMDASQLINRPADVTRSTVQKAVVVIDDSPQSFGLLRERLGMVTQAWFVQRDFTDVEILRRFQESLGEEKARGLLNGVDRDAYLGMSLREMIKDYKWQTLVLLKCCILQPKMLFFGSRCEKLCMMQFALVSLIPGLIRKLNDCADPELDSNEKNFVRPTNLRTSSRTSMQAWMGLPLQLFGKGSLFGPYTPLQQLDILADVGTKSYIVGSTNSLLLQQKDRYSDILINLDDETMNITSPSLKQALQLSIADRRWIDFLTQTINDTWDSANPSRPKTMGYMGSEEFIRLQFEDYLLALLSCVKYHNFLSSPTTKPAQLIPHIEGDPAVDFNMDFVEAWQRTENYRIWNANTDSHLFDIVEPKHLCAGGLTIDDVQRRITQQVADLHLDEKIAQSREVVGRNLQAGKEKASTMLNKLYADMEAFRETQKKKAEEARIASQQQQQPQSQALTTSSNGDSVATSGALSPLSPTGSHTSFNSAELSNRAQQTMASAGAYMSSWASWAGEKRKAMSIKSPTTSPAFATPSGDETPGSTSGGSSRRLGLGSSSGGAAAFVSGWGLASVRRKSHQQERMSSSSGGGGVGDGSGTGEASTAASSVVEREDEKGEEMRGEETEKEKGEEVKGQIDEKEVKVESQATLPPSGGDETISTVI